MKKALLLASILTVIFADHCMAMDGNTVTVDKLRDLMGCTDLFNKNGAKKDYQIKDSNDPASGELYKHVGYVEGLFRKQRNLKSGYDSRVIGSNLARSFSYSENDGARTITCVDLIKVRNIDIQVYKNFFEDSEQHLNRQEYDSINEHAAWPKYSNCLMNAILDMWPNLDWSGNNIAVNLRIPTEDWQCWEIQPDFPPTDNPATGQKKITRRLTCVSDSLKDKPVVTSEWCGLREAHTHVPPLYGALTHTKIDNGVEQLSLRITKSKAIIEHKITSVGYVALATAVAGITYGAVKLYAWLNGARG